MFFIPFTKNYNDYNQLIILAKQQQPNNKLIQILNQSSKEVYIAFMTYIIQTLNVDILEMKDLDLSRLNKNIDNFITEIINDLELDFVDEMNYYLKILLSIQRIHKDLKIDNIMYYCARLYGKTLQNCRYDQYNIKVNFEIIRLVSESFKQIIDLDLQYDQEKVRCWIAFDVDQNLFDFENGIKVLKILKIEL